MKDVKIFISSVLIITSFFVWYFFSESQKAKKQKLEKNYVGIEILKTKIKISKDENTEITINWDLIQGEFYDLK